MEIATTSRLFLNTVRLFRETIYFYGKNDKERDYLVISFLWLMFCILAASKAFFELEASRNPILNSGWYKQIRELLETGQIKTTSTLGNYDPKIWDEIILIGWVFGFAFFAMLLYWIFSYFYFRGILIANLVLSVIITWKASLFFIIPVVIVVLIPVNIIVRPGSGRYYRFLYTVTFLMEIWHRTAIEHNTGTKGSSDKKALRIWGFIVAFIVYVVSGGLLVKVFLGWPTLSAMIVILVFTVLVAIYNSHSKIVEIAWKFAIFIFFLLTAVYSSAFISSSVLQIATQTVAIFLAFDRLFNLWITMKTLIKNESILYYYECPSIKQLDLWNELKPLPSGNLLIADTAYIAKQVIIRYRLNLFDEVEEICDKYLKSNATEIRQLMQGIYWRVRGDISDLIPLEEIVSWVVLTDQLITPTEELLFIADCMSDDERKGAKLLALGIYLDNYRVLNEQQLFFVRDNSVLIDYEDIVIRSVIRTIKHRCKVLERNNDRKP